MLEKIRNIRDENSFLNLRVVYIGGMIFFQILTPILFIRGYGLGKYGIWIMSVSLVTFFNFIDLGFFNSIINKVIGLRAENLLEQSETLLETLWILLFRVTSFLVFVILCVWIFGFGEFNPKPLLVLLALASIFQVLIRLNEAIARAHLDSTGFRFLVMAYFFESICLMMGLYNRLSFENLALLLLASRLFFVLVGNVMNRARINYSRALEIKWNALFLFARRNLKEGLFFLVMPLGNLLLFDGSNIVLGLYISKEFVAELNLLRISTGVIRQFSSAVLTSYSPYISHAMYSNDSSMIHKLRTRIRSLLLIGVGAISLGLVVMTNFLFSNFFKNSALISTTVFYIFLVSVILDIPWNFRASFIFAVNRHVKISMGFLTSSLLALLFVYPLAQNLGLLGVALAYSVQDVLLTGFAFKKSSEMIRFYGTNRVVE